MGEMMINHFHALLLAVPVGLVLVSSRSSAPRGAPDVEWRTDLGAATAEADADGRPLLIVFR